ncbi:MAG: ABC-three component system protein [Ignavibacteria bacterium]
MALTKSKKKLSDKKPQDKDIGADLFPPEMPKSINLLTNNDVFFGSPIPAIDRLKIVSPDDFEDIVREWIAGYCKTIYIKVWKAGGANDKGRDVVAILNSKNEYDNFQCKHYDHPLSPTDIWKELGKLCYYTYNKSFILPRKYFFVSPQGIGPKLVELFSKPKDLENELLKNWDKYCKNEITEKEEVVLSTKLLRHIKKIDFSIFTFLDPQELIEQHKKTNYYAARFGGGLTNRKNPIINDVSDNDMLLRYVEQLFIAYSDYLKTNLKTIKELKAHSELLGHFNRQRECFYWAESLDQFSRDSLPLGNTSFQELKDEIYQAVVDIANSIHSDGYENIKKTTSEASKINIQSNALLSVSLTQDKIGICHHLANENKLIWVKL